jgi:K+-transporting ATPase KdpF subunit
MDLENVLLLLVSVAVLGYLFFALVRPEKF